MSNDENRLYVLLTDHVNQRIDDLKEDITEVRKCLDEVNKTIHLMVIESQTRATTCPHRDIIEAYKVEREVRKKEKDEQEKRDRVKERKLRMVMVIFTIINIILGIIFNKI